MLQPGRIDIRWHAVAAPAPPRACLGEGDRDAKRRGGGAIPSPGFPSTALRAVPLPEQARGGIWKIWRPVECRHGLIALCASAILACAGPATSALAAPEGRPNAAAAPSASSPEAAVQAFVSAFNALDRTRFDSLFAEDVTLFFPSAPFPVRRIEGKVATLSWFGRFFDSLRKRGAGPGIQPQDLKVQVYGDVAIATFHLGGGDSVGRRTVVLRRQRGRWAIAHLHASSETERR